ncbi:MAG TPA: MarR family transcriptional regulator [Bradyrhizobium sp.]
MSETKRIADCNSWTLRKAARRVTQAYDEVMAPSGVRSTQFAVLALIAERPGLSINDLAGLMVMDRTTTGKNLRPLERDGLISVVAAPDDLRSRRVNLTKRGLNLLMEAMPLWIEAQRQFEHAHGKAFASNLRKLLGQVSAHKGGQASN